MACIPQDQLKEVFNTAVAGGVNFFDTAEVEHYISANLLCVVSSTSANLCC